MNYSYDAQGYVSGITVNPVNANGVGWSGNEVTLLSALSYSAEGRVTGWLWSDGKARTIAYDSNGMVTAYNLGDAAGSGSRAGTLRTVTRDAAGRITGYSHANNGTAQSSLEQGFAYDNLNRLLSVSGGGGSSHYSYDETGNRTSKTIAGMTYTNTVASTSNRLTQTQDVPGTATIQYDAAGHITDDGTNSFTYSDRGRMTSANNAGGTVIYKYNGLNQRVYKSGPTVLVPSGAAHFLYGESGQLLGEYDSTGAPIYETIYLGVTPVGAIKQTGAGADSNIAVTLYNVHSDHIATARLITQQDQTIVWRWDTAEAFGGTAPDQNPSSLGTFVYNQRFPGQVFDQETGLFQNWNREYNARTGRYIQSDLAGLAGGVNTFAYAEGSPLAAFDPYGLYSLDELIDDSANFSAGWGDMLSFGITAQIRKGLNIGSVNKCSAAYKGGEAFGFVNGLALGWAQGAKAAAKASSANNWANFSHSAVPHAKMKGSTNPAVRWFDKTGNRMNGDFVSPELHTRMDAAAQFGLSPEWLAANPLFSPMRQQWNRVPYVPGAALYGGGSALINGCGCNN